MRMPARHQATDCDNRPKDWADLGAQILRAAAIASAMHQAERAGRIAKESTVSAPSRQDLSE